MTTIVHRDRRRSGSHGRGAFAISAILFVAFALVMTIVAPIALSVCIVFLFAGPHNYAEARYFLSRSPARMGRLRPFFLCSFAGIVLLTVGLPLVGRLPGWMNWSPTAVLYCVAVWNAAFVMWCTWLIHMRSRQRPRRDWDYAWPVGVCVVGLSCLQPVVLPLLLVYLHPLMGLWVLDAEIARSRPEWRPVYRCCLLLVAPAVSLIWLAGPDSGSAAAIFDVSENVQGQIRQHSGAHVLPMLNSEKLIATHAFLELLHYGVWLVAVPFVNGRVFSGRFPQIPLMKRSIASRKTIKLVLLMSLGGVVLLWIGFAADYSTTRDIYFTAATFHVLAEVPFLLRLL